MFEKLMSPILIYYIELSLINWIQRTFSGSHMRIKMKDKYKP